MSYISLLIHDIIVLITIFNPIAAASIMLGIVDSEKDIKAIATRASITLLIAALVTLYGGDLIFKLFGINLLSLKVIGGVILMIMAVNMIYGEGAKFRHSKEEASEAQEKDDISIVPLAIPILFGPGAIATIVVLMHNNLKVVSSHWSYILLTLSIIISAAIVYWILKNAIVINRVLGVSGIKILNRVMGLIVGAIAAQFLVAGIKGLWVSY
ncbi:MAG: NAAT family transporter [Epsilonproteobacteria bacterium]|nr:NAAT family transporter [Campylobacterota bacterium]